MSGIQRPRDYMSCKTCGEGTACACLRSVFVRLFGTSVHQPQPQPPKERGDFLRLFVKNGQDYPTRVHLCSEAEAVSTSIRCGKKRSFLLRNVRIGFDRVADLHLCRCAGCGFTEMRFSDDLIGERFGCCSQCKARVSDQACGAWHSWGICELCSGEKVEECPFPVADDGGHLAAASHAA